MPVKMVLIGSFLNNMVVFDRFKDRIEVFKM
jgi:hypothetical protein